MADESERAYGEAQATAHGAKTSDDRRDENAITPSLLRESEREARSPTRQSEERREVGNGASQGSDMPSAAPKARKAKASLEVGDVPEEIAERYFTEARGKGQGFYPDAQTKEAAFHDTGNKLSAGRTDPNVIADMLKVAEHRGWDKLDVSGAAEFRREVWMQGQERGVEVAGYKPTERDLQELERRQQGRALETGGEIRQRDVVGSTREVEDEDERHSAETGVTGKLVEAGQAPYQGRKDADPSPYVKLELDGGQTKTLWGVGLPDALQRAGVEIGDTVTVKRDGFEQVTKQVMVRDAETGKPVRDGETGKPLYQEKSVGRGMWTVTAERFLNAGKESRMEDPALRGADSQMRVVESFVNRNVADPAARARLVNSAKDEIAKGLAKGARYVEAKVVDKRHLDRTFEKPVFERQKQTETQRGIVASQLQQNRPQPDAGDAVKAIEKRMAQERREPERERSR